MTSGDLLVDGGRVANVFVWISDGVDARAGVPPAPDEAVEIDQRGCVYVPRVVGVRVRQPVAFVNSDPLLHNVHALPAVNREFNLGMPGGASAREHAFSRPETMVRLKCDVHPWMGAWIGVVDHPWFAVTGADGRFELPPLPPGEYELSAWHERLGEQTRRVTVGEGEVVQADFSFEAP
jgi:plastocyanin